MRASDAEREHTVEALRTAAADGRLTLEELAERVEHALVATTREALEPLTADLPEPTARTSSCRRASRWSSAASG